jgi:hypothetical protein
MPNRYSKIKEQITERYEKYYLHQRTSEALAEDIKDLTLDDIIFLLEEVKNKPELTQMSLYLSRRSDLFDKLVLMVGKSQSWVLRLHTYNVVRQCEEPGYVFSNLNRKIRDDENHIHEHSWQLTSRFLIGGLKNHQYSITGEGQLFNRYNLVPTSGDGVSNKKTTRKAKLEGQKRLRETREELYQQGDLVHYPLDIPHKVDTQASSFLGMTITLAHTSERHHENSFFYEKIQSLQNNGDVQELAVDAYTYNRDSLNEALNTAITSLKLIKLCDQLAEAGFRRFNRFWDPLSMQPGPSNVLETELLPTIAMLLFQKGSDFKEHPMTEELRGCNPEKTRKLKEQSAETSGTLRELIECSIKTMHKHSLKQLIKSSQQNLMAKLYTPFRCHLASEVQDVLEKRQKNIPVHVLGSLSLFSKKSTKTLSNNLSVESLKGGASLANTYNQKAYYEKWVAEGNPVSLVPYGS